MGNVRGQAIKQAEEKAGKLKQKHSRQSVKESVGMGQYIYCRADGKRGAGAQVGRGGQVMGNSRKRGLLQGRREWQDLK